MQQQFKLGPLFYGVFAVFNKMKLVMSLIVFASLNATIVVADPCRADGSECYDPDYGTAVTTNFNNQYHYVFVGAHPDDELLLYPSMKNYCAEDNAYCAMIIGSRGKSGCPARTAPEDCGNERAEELRASARYLEADVWLYDLPSGEEDIAPYNSAGIKAAFNLGAERLGYDDMVDFLKTKFRALKTPSSILHIITLNPDHGSTQHPEHMVMGSLVSEAVDQLSREMSIYKIFVESILKFSEPTPSLPRPPPYLSKSNANSPICVNGADLLTVTNTHLTNFEAFNYGYNEIYKGQKFHAGDNFPVPSAYEFCYEFK